jgi:hypothetical protein
VANELFREMVLRVGAVAFSHARAVVALDASRFPPG